MNKRTSLILSMSKSLLNILAVVILISGCATSQRTKPEPLALAEHGYNDKILAVMPLGQLNPVYQDYMSQKYESWFMPKAFFGTGETSFLKDPYEELALAIYNRLRGYDIFKRVVIVKDRQEADKLGAYYLLCFRINNCFSLGEGPNWDFVHWITYKGILDVDVIVYNLEQNERIYAEKIRSEAYTTSPWSTPDVRGYLRRTLLRGVTFHNGIARINF